MSHGTTPFGAGVIIYGVIAIITALIALELLSDTMAVRHEFLRLGINGARKRYARLRAQGDAIEVIGQLLMLAAAVVAYDSPEHTEAWLLSILSLFELLRIAINLNKRRTRIRTMEDMARADQQQE